MNAKGSKSIRFKESFQNWMQRLDDNGRPVQAEPVRLSVRGRIDDVDSFVRGGRELPIQGELKLSPNAEPIPVSGTATFFKEGSPNDPVTFDYRLSSRPSVDSPGVELEGAKYVQRGVLHPFRDLTTLHTVIYEVKGEGDRTLRWHGDLSLGVVGVARQVATSARERRTSLRRGFREAGQRPLSVMDRHETYVSTNGNFRGLALEDAMMKKVLPRSIAGNPVVLCADSGVEEVATQIVGLAKAAHGKPVLVAIDGPSGAGKGFYTQKLADSVHAQLTGGNFGPNPVRLVELDNWFTGLPHPSQPISPTNHFDLPEAMDKEGMWQALSTLKEGLPIAQPIYSFADAARVGVTPVQPAPVIIAEGLWALDKEIPADLRVRIDSSTETQLLRRLLRDVNRGVLTPTQILHYFFENLLPAQEEHLVPRSVRADVILRTEYRPAIESHRAPDRTVQLKHETQLTIADLEARGARVISREHHEDDYLTLQNGKKYEHSLRIRKSPEGTALTYKGTPDEAVQHARSALTAEVQPSLVQLFEGAGFTRDSHLEKERTVLQLDGVEVRLDEFKMGNGHVRRFLEVVADSKDQSKEVERVAQKLLSGDGWTSRLYVELFGAEG